jgi:hypothetical protein
LREPSRRATIPGHGALREECAAVSRLAWGWQARLLNTGEDDEEDGEQAVAFYCPACAAREFGEAPPR